MDLYRVAAEAVTQPDPFDDRIRGGYRKGQKRAHHTSKLPAHGHGDEDREIRHLELASVHLGDDEIALDCIEDQIEPDHREYVFYSRDVEAFVGVLNAMPQEATPYPIEIDRESDPGGEFYRSFAEAIGLR